MLRKLVEPFIITVFFFLWELSLNTLSFPTKSLLRACKRVVYVQFKREREVFAEIYNVLIFSQRVYPFSSLYLTDTFFFKSELIEKTIFLHKEMRNFLTYKEYIIKKYVYILED